MSAYNIITIYEEYTDLNLIQVQTRKEGNWQQTENSCVLSQEIHFFWAKIIYMQKKLCPKNYKI